MASDPLGLRLAVPRWKPFQYPGGPLTWILDPPLQWQPCGTSVENPDWRRLKKPCADCDSAEMKNRQEFVDLIASSFCAGRNPPLGQPVPGGPPPPVPWGQTTYSTGLAEIILTGNPCIDYCLCRHETQHALQIRFDRIRRQRVPDVRKECDAYMLESSCLGEFLDSQ